MWEAQDHFDHLHKQRNYWNTKSKRRKESRFERRSTFLNHASAAVIEMDFLNIDVYTRQHIAPSKTITKGKMAIRTVDSRCNSFG